MTTPTPDPPPAAPLTAEEIAARARREMTEIAQIVATGATDPSALRDLNERFERASAAHRGGRSGRGGDVMPSAVYLHDGEHQITVTFRTEQDRERFKAHYRTLDAMGLRFMEERDEARRANERLAGEVAALRDRLARAEEREQQLDSLILWQGKALTRAEARCGELTERLSEILGDGSIVITRGEMTEERWITFVQWATSLPSIATPTDGAARGGER